MENRHILSGQWLLSGSVEVMQHIRATILEDHLVQNRRGIREHGLDLIGVLSDFSCFLENSSDISGGTAVGGGSSTDDIFNRADGLDKVLLDCWMEL